jgi:hypothetical protein
MAAVSQGTRRGHAGRHRGDVFPALGFWVGGGTIAGAMLSLSFVRVTSASSNNLLLLTALGASLGAVIGVFTGLGKGIWQPGPSLPPLASPPVSLWDPWLDSGRDIAPIPPESADLPFLTEEAATAIMVGSNVSTSSMHVRPRVISPDTGEAIRLDDEIGRLIQDGRHRLVGLVSGPGSGKTTALHYLATTLPPWALAHVRLLNKPDHHAEVVALIVSSGTVPQ